MRAAQAGFLFIAAVVVIVLSQWGTLADYFAQLQDTGRPRAKEVVIWSDSGTPEFEKRQAREFMKWRDETYLDINFRQSGQLGSTLHVAFLSGNPPHMLSVAKSDMRDMVAAGMLRPMTDLLERTARAMPRYELAVGESVPVFAAPEGGGEAWGTLTLLSLADDGRGATVRWQGLAPAPPREFTIPLDGSIPETPVVLEEIDTNSGRGEFQISLTQQRLAGDQSLVFFRVDPNDPLLTLNDAGEFEHPEEAARLLKMHGQFVGFAGADPGSVLTYNKRLFRDAAKHFLRTTGSDHGLLDPVTGEAAPPRTWAELLAKARLITQYGRETGTGVYGIALQGQTPKDIMRGLEPLMATAGSRGFDFRTGRFAFEDNATVAGFKLLAMLKAEGSVMPGTSSRQFEETRDTVAQGKAAMLIDGWWSAMVALERTPWARNDMGSAPVPVPYGMDDAGRPVAAEREGIQTLLGVSPIGRGVGWRGGQTGTTCLTAGTPYPWEAWLWMNFGLFNPELDKVGTRRGGVPSTLLAVQRLDDPEWFPFPYQRQLWGIFQQERFWPEPPLRPQVGRDYQNILQAAFLDTDLRADAEDYPQRLAELEARVRRELRDYDQRLNRELENQIASGRMQPEGFTFTDFDPMEPGDAFDRQSAAGTPADVAKIKALRQKLPPPMRAAPAVELFDEFETSASASSALAVPALMMLVVLAFLLTVGARGATGASEGLTATLRASRRHWYAYVFVFPAMLALFAFVLYPSLYQFYLATLSGEGIGEMEYVGLGQFAKVFGWGEAEADRAFWFKVLPNTALYMVVVTSGQVVIALLLANLLNLPLRLAGTARVLFFVPLVTSMAAVAVVFRGLLAGPDSTVNVILDAIGLENLPYWLGLVNVAGASNDWLGNPDTDLWAVMAVAIWHGLPYNIILILAALQAIDPQLYEAAKVDGAGPRDRFVHVTIPEILPILVVIIFNALIGAAKAFGTVFILTEGGKDHSSEVVATYIFKWGFTKTADLEPDIGYASALGIVYALILAALTFVNVYLIARRWRRRLHAEQRGGEAEAEPEEAVATRTAAPGPKGLQTP